MKLSGLWLFAFLLLFSTAYGQSDYGKLKGQVTDEAGDGVPYATVKIMQNGILKGGANSDADGNYSIVGITPGTYDAIVSYSGIEKTYSGVVIVTGKTKVLDLKISTEIELETVVITEPIDFDQTTTISTFDKKQIQETGFRDINTVVAIAAGAVPASGGISMRGMRSQGTTYYVDGVKMRGVVSLPQKSIEQINVITGGTPAEYGDMVGGVVSITTSGPSYQLSGGGEILTSAIYPSNSNYVGFDPFGYTLAGINAAGPIIQKYDSADDYNKTILGFMVAAEYEHDMDNGPSIGIPTVNPTLRADLQENPLILDPESGSFFAQRANFLTSDDIITIKRKEFSEDTRRRVTARFDFQPSETIVVKAGGSYEDIVTDSWGLGSALLCPEGNQLFEGRLVRGWMRFQQMFKGSEDSKLKNFFYMLQADYNSYHREFMNREHRDRFFDYGHIGTFNYDRREVLFSTEFIPDLHSTTISQDDYLVTVGYASRNLTFDDVNSKNPLMANYNNFIFDWVENNGIVNPFSGLREYSISSLDFLSFYRGLRNGDSPQGIYSLYSGTGSNAGGYTKFNYDQSRITGQASGELGGHNLKFGFEFEQRNERFYTVGARPLWFYMRQLANRHLSQLETDTALWNPVYVEGVFQDTVHRPIYFDAEQQSTFDRRLREQLGMDANGLDYLITDALSPETFSLDLFSADELLNDGNSYVGYYGYTYTGERMKSLNQGQFFTDKENRPLNPFSPTYIAGYVQDKFELEDMIFNIGLRVDRFDANQPVLKDEYSLYPTFTAADAASQFGITLPDAIGTNFVPYMDDATNPSSAPVGYRDPETNIWYDATGAPVSSAALRQGGKVQPWVLEEEVTMNSFQDYEPQTVVMPRLSFSFPISGEAVFFAHYDVLSQRPGQTGVASGSALAGRVSDFYYLQNNPTIQVLNPNLKPERTIDYEVGFKQKVGDYMALSVSAFYREMRNLIQSQSFVDAYPISYSSFNNIDFGTVKGFTFALNMLRKRNLRMNISYTLQFAYGTGSSFTSARNATNSIEGFTVIRTLLPLDFDRRHRFTGNFDYRYFGGENKGPGIKLGENTIYPFKDMGLNGTFFMTSGTPYSVNSLPNPAQVQGGINSTIQLAGTPNGSRLPWQMALDLKIDKSFMLGGSAKLDADGNEMKTKGGQVDKTKEYSVNVYFLFLNALNLKNINGVYATSGLPDDDGYLSTGVGQQAVAAAIDPNSFAYLYSLKAANPGNFSGPRRIRLGIQFSF